jgi:integrase
LDQFIGHLTLDKVHTGTLQSFVESRKKDGCKTKTINLALGTVRHVLNLAAMEWIDENGLTWLQAAPKIKLIPVLDARKPYPISWEEQERLFSVLPLHLRQMALFKVNTGCREQEVCRLRWEWEIQVPELGTSIFIIPAQFVKNREDRLVVLNHIAKAMIEEVRGNHKTFVFTYKNHPISRMLNSAWKRAREGSGVNIRVHDLKHTFGRRLRAAGVSFEDRQDLLGHRSGRITTHYSAAELENLIAAANKVCDQHGQSPVLTILKTQSERKVNGGSNPHIFPTIDNSNIIELRKVSGN